MEQAAPLKRLLGLVLVCAWLPEPIAFARLPARTAVVTKHDRLAAIRRAQIWTPTDVQTMDLRLGPQGAGAFHPGALVACDYVKAALRGNTRKFDCAVGPNDVVNVRYGVGNGHVEGAVLATRLLWALGFGADRVYQVRVACRGCSSDPWKERERTNGVHVFDPAVVERRPAGHEIRSKGHVGWAWSELDLVGEAAGGAPKAQRDALTLFAVLMQHSDSKPEPQRLICPRDDFTDTTCATPFMYFHDVGLTFGRANTFNSDHQGSVSFDQWATTPIWRDTAACVGYLPRSHTGTLGDPRIGEAGRRFLADVLAQLTETQLHDLFEVARVDRRSRKPGSTEPAATVEEWVTAFKHKRTEIVGARCPS